MKLLLYCTKAKPYLYGMYSGFESRYGYHLTNDKDVFNQHNVLNGKIVAECDYEVEEINVLDCSFRTFNLVEKEILNKSCLTYHELFEYLKNRCNPRGYAIHIKNLNIFDKPRELNSTRYKNHSVKSAPQNMMKVYDYSGEYYILISIRPQWLCKILNGEKTIEIRKKVLREMLI